MLAESSSGKFIYRAQGSTKVLKAELTRDQRQPENGKPERTAVEAI
jgi:hypothetical protein